MRLSHAIADTLVTPINDSFIDLDVLGRVDPQSFAVTGSSHYAELVREGMRSRHLRQRRNRLGGHPQPAVDAGQPQPGKVVTALKELAALLEFRVADGVCERVIFRELFPMGLTAFDTFDRATLGVRPTMSHVAARQEVSELVAFLNLPVPAPAAGEEEALTEPLSRAG